MFKIKKKFSNIKTNVLLSSLREFVGLTKLSVELTSNNKFKSLKLIYMMSTKFT